METGKNLERGLLGLTTSPRSDFLLCGSCVPMCKSGLKGLARKKDQGATSMGAKF